MIWIYTLIGIVIGGTLAELTGLLIGGVLGYLFAVVLQNKQLLEKLSQNQASLERQFSLFRTAVKVEARVGSRAIDEAKTASEKAVVSKIADAPSDNVSQTIEPDEVVSSASKVNHSSSYNDYQRSSSQIQSSKNAWQAPATSNVINETINKIIILARNYFVEGNLIVSIGVVVLFFGASFLVKYSIDNGLIPIEFRLIGLLLAGLVILVIGWRLRLKTPGYALIMQGGAIAIIYLTIFACFKLYALIPAAFAFSLLIVFSILSMLLAVLQNSRALAIAAMAGGFASPILASTGSDNHIGLFSYYLILNLAIFGVSWFKSWRILNVLGFAFTFIIGTLWGVTRYKAENFATTEPFLIAFFLIYVAISIIFAIKQKPQLKGYVDGTLVFGVPLVSFGLQAALVHNIEYGLAWSAFSLGLFYLVSAKVLWNNSNTNFRLLCEAMLALGVIFATLTIPFALDGRWTAASWAIEGAGLVWVGLRQQRTLVKAFGIITQLVGGLLFVIDYPYRYDATAFLNSEYLGSIIVAIAGLITFYLLTQKEDNDNKKNYLAMLFLFWSLSWWYIGALFQIDRHLHASYDIAVYVIFFSISALLWLAVNLRYPRNLFRFFTWLLIIPLWIYFFVARVNDHLFGDFGYLAWPFAIATIYSIFYHSDKKQIVLTGSNLLHTFSYLLLTAILCIESYWYLNKNLFVDSWSVSMIALIIVISFQAINRLDIWPFKQHPDSYHKITALILLVVIAIWTVVGNFSQFLSPAPLPYISLVNPIDMVQFLALFSIIEWYRKGQHSLGKVMGENVFYLFIGGFCFIWFNVMLLKTIHLIDGVPYQLEALFNSAVVQMSLSISWTVIGLLIMVMASKKSHRKFWIVGASLTCLVVVKLFLLDLSDRGTVERIISFMVVGALLLVVGYFSPVPPTINNKEGESVDA